MKRPMPAERAARSALQRYFGRGRWSDPARLVLLAFAIALGVGFAWGLPGTDSWAADSISPRSCGLGAIVETYRPGHFHHYPPLHMGLLTVVSLPWMGLAAIRAGTDAGALALELVKPLYMTGIEVGARLVSCLMAIAIVKSAMGLWTRLAGGRAGVVAGAVAGANAVFVFYAHTGNLDVPYVFWLSLMLVELDRVACGEPREMRVMLLATAAALTKDQAAAALFLTLPVYLVLVPWLARRTPPARRTLVIAVLAAAAVYAVASGAAVNPAGFRARIAHLFGPASKPEMHYPGGIAGAIALTRDELRWTTDFTSWPIVLAAFAGLAVAIARGPALVRARRLLPLVASVSFVLFFSLPVRQRDHRYFLPESLFFSAYAAMAFEAAWQRASSARARAFVGVAAALCLAPAVLRVASMDATLVVDSRYAAERFLEALPPGTHVEVVGGPIFMPRIPARLDAVRPGIEPVGERQAIAGVVDLVDPAMDPRPRAPRAIVLATELSDLAMADPARGWVTFATMQYRDPTSRAFLGRLYDGSLGYERVLRATCSLPWPLACVRMHHSTGGEVWIYAPSGP
jgi:hypothetical protein